MMWSANRIIVVECHLPPQHQYHPSVACSLSAAKWRSLPKCLSDFGAFISGRRQLYTYLVPAWIAISLFSQTTTQVMRDARNRNNYHSCQLSEIQIRDMPHPLATPTNEYH